MTDKKLTDNEIIKALECCGKPVNEECCSECPYHLGGEELCHKLIGDTIELINRQKAEIERLTGARNTDPMDFCGVLCRYAEELINKAKAEAVKEFAERLKTEFSQYQREYRNVLNDEGACAMIIAKKGVNNLLKELIGE